MKSIRYSIVIPCYSSGAWLAELAARIGQVMAPHSPFELILVNDHSPDVQTWAAIEELAERYEFVRGIDLLYRVGQFKATLCGLELAVGNHVITMDDDLQHPPEELVKLIEAMRDHP
ncbi:MAG TPA: glycosyltransferase, partial [bacterium]|nr:glycosyltransferase [bacterium]HPG84381.1 glycosyltransferase [bacterium]